MGKFIFVTSVIFAVVGLACTFAGLSTLTMVIVFALLIGIFTLVMYLSKKTKRYQVVERKTH